VKMAQPSATTERVHAKDVFTLHLRQFKTDYVPALLSTTKSKIWSYFF
jgi:hypothetical protein